MGLADQTTAWVCAAANEVDVLETVQTIPWTEVEHLIHGMSQVECSADEDISLFPPLRSDTALFNNMIAEIFHARVLDDTIEDFFLVSVLIIFPWVLGSGVDCGHENLELRVTFRGHRRICDARVSYVNRRVRGNDFFVLDVT